MRGIFSRTRRFFSHTGTGARRRGKVRPASALRLEVLEDRTVPAVGITAFDPAAGAITFTGDQNGTTADSLVLSEVNEGGEIRLAHNLTGNGTGDYASPTDIDPGPGVAHLVIGSGSAPLITVNLMTDNDSLTLDSSWSFWHEITVDGGTGTNTLNGPDLNVDWTVTDTNSGVLTLSDPPTQAGTRQVSFANFQTLQGGAGIDSFHVNASAQMDLKGGDEADTFAFADGVTLTGAVDGEAGGATLDLSASASPAAVTLTGAGANGYSGTDGVTGGFSGIGAVIGGSLSGGTLTGLDAAATWTLDDSPTYSDGSHTLSFSNFATLEGGSGADTFDVNAATTADLQGGAGDDHFAFADGATLAGTIDGGTGSDTLDFAAYTTPVSIGLSGSDATGFGGADGISGGFTGIDAVISGSAGDTLAGYNADATWSIGSGKTYTAESHSLIFSGFEFLQGGTGADEFDFAASATWTGGLDGGGGSDTLDLSANTSGIVVTLSGSDATGYGGAAAGVLGSFSGMDTLKAANNATLTGEDADATWTVAAARSYDDGTATLNVTGFGTFQGGAGADTFDITASTSVNLRGGAGDDRFVFQSDNVALIGSVTGQAGANTLDYSGYSTTAVTITLTGSGATLGFAGTATNLSGGFSNISTVVGGAGSADTLTGRNVASTWSLDAGQTYSDGVATLALSGFETLQGGSASDTFTISTSTTADLKGGAGNDRFNFTVDDATLAGTIDGGLGTDTVSYAGWTSAVQVHLADLTSIENVIGGAGSDTLVGADTANAWSVTANNAGKVGPVAFSSFENLTGGSGADSFTFSNGKGISGTLDGGGADTMSFAAYLRGVTVNVSGTNAGTISSTGVSFSFTGVENWTGGLANDSVVFGAGGAFTGGVSGGAGSDTMSFAAYTNAVTVNVTGMNAGSVSSAGVSFNFSGIENWTGGSGGDAVVFAAGKSLTGTLNGGAGNDRLDFSAYTYGVLVSVTANNGGRVTGRGVGLGFSAIESWTGGAGNDIVAFANGKGMSGSLDGGGGTDLLDYSASMTGVLVNLAAGQATGVGGGIANFENVNGGAGNDILIGDDNANVLVGNAGNDILVGNGGNDRLYGGAGRDILIGGAGADYLNGGAGDDLLIAGATSYDANATALGALMAEWARTDMSYASRIAHLTGAVTTGQRNGSYVLDGSTVSHDAAVNALFGGTEYDWFLASSGDALADRIGGEMKTLF